MLEVGVDTWLGAWLPRCFLSVEQQRRSEGTFESASTALSIFSCLVALGTLTNNDKLPLLPREARLLIT